MLGTSYIFDNWLDFSNFLLDSGMDPLSLTTMQSLMEISLNKYSRDLSSKLSSGPSLDTFMNGVIKAKLEIIPKGVSWGGQSNLVFSVLSDDFMKSRINERAISIYKKQNEANKLKVPGSSVLQKEDESTSEPFDTEKVRPVDYETSKATSQENADLTRNIKEEANVISLTEELVMLMMPRNDILNSSGSSVALNHCLISDAYQVRMSLEKAPYIYV